MFGIFLDVTGRKQAEESNELLAGEMSHRVKNLLAMASGLTAITSRSATSLEDMARELTGRLTALGSSRSGSSYVCRGRCGCVLECSWRIGGHRRDVE